MLLLLNQLPSFFNELWPKHSPAKLSWQYRFNYNLYVSLYGMPYLFTYLPLFNFLLKTQATAMTIPVLILTTGTHSMECTEQSVEKHEPQCANLFQPWTSNSSLDSSGGLWNIWIFTRKIWLFQMKMRSLVDFGYIEQVISKNPARENPWKCSF